MKNIAPHKLWLNAIGEILEIKGTKDEKRYKTMSFIDAFKCYFKEHVLDKYTHEQINEIMDLFSIWYPISTCTEFIIDWNILENKINKFMDKTTENIVDKTLVDKFFYPFEDVVITFQNKGKYLPYFITIFKMQEQYLNKNGEYEPVYLIKTCVAPRLVPDKKQPFFPVINEFMYIKSLFNKFIITCKTDSHFFIEKMLKLCVNRVMPIGIKERLGGDILEASADWCVKSWNNRDSCPRRSEGVFYDYGSEDSSYVTLCFDSFKIVCFVLERFHNRRTVEEVGTERRIVSPREVKKELKSKSNTIQNRVIRVSTYKTTGVKGSKTGVKHSSHKSPVEHERRGHYRHYKSGKVVYINAMMVNKGKGEKPSYKLID